MFPRSLLTTVSALLSFSDGRGGADGGCQRFEPELSWEDNGNLAHAHKLVQPIKLKYGLGLSWGDLMVLAGNVAIESMCGPILGYAAGRMDHIDNSQTISLGPSKEQQQFCPVGNGNDDGNLPFPLGSNTMQLIYVNPQGKDFTYELQVQTATLRQRNRQLMACSLSLSLFLSSYL